MLVGRFGSMPAMAVSIGACRLRLLSWTTAPPARVFRLPVPHHDAATLSVTLASDFLSPPSYADFMSGQTLTRIPCAAAAAAASCELPGAAGMIAL